MSLEVLVDLSGLVDAEGELRKRERRRAKAEAALDKMARSAARAKSGEEEGGGGDGDEKRLEAMESLRRTIERCREEAEFLAEARGENP